VGGGGSSGLGHHGCGRLLQSIGVGDGGWGGGKNSRKIFFGQLLYHQFRHFSDKTHVKFRNFVNFSGKYHKNLGILIIFRQESFKIRAFSSFLIHIFFGKNFVPPKVG